MQPEPQPLNSPEDVEAIRKVIREGGNPLIETDVPRWEDQVGVSRIVNRRVVEIEPLPTPAQVLADMPLSEDAQRPGACRYAIVRGRAARGGRIPRRDP